MARIQRLRLERAMTSPRRARSRQTITALAAIAAVGLAACRASSSTADDARGDGVTDESSSGDTGGAAGTFACPSESAGTTHVAPCPPSCPSDGTACAPEGTACEYGDDPRGPPCRALARCLGGAWRTAPPSPTNCEPVTPAADCPASSAASGQACAVEHSWCALPTDGTDCICTTCDWLGYVFLGPCPAGKPRWQCLARPAGLDARCPAVPPTAGTTCTTDVSCGYQCGAVGIRSCQGGVWKGLDGSPCPISRRAFKRDIEQLGPEDLQRLYDELREIQLATYRYRSDGPAGPRRLGFMIDDVKSRFPVDPEGNTVDLYGYMSMAVAAVQVQAREIAALRAEVAALKKARAKAHARPPTSP
jgi:hypothetical protein